MTDQVRKIRISLYNSKCYSFKTDPWFLTRSDFRKMQLFRLSYWESSPRFESFHLESSFMLKTYLRCSLCQLYISSMQHRICGSFKYITTLLFAGITRTSSLCSRYLTKTWTPCWLRSPGSTPTSSTWTAPSTSSTHTPSSTTSNSFSPSTRTSSAANRGWPTSWNKYTTLCRATHELMPCHIFSAAPAIMLRMCLHLSIPSPPLKEGPLSSWQTDKKDSPPPFVRFWQLVVR